MRSATTRFSDRVENYVRYRPGYPEEVLRTLAKEAELTPESQIIDVGSGTGISSELFLRNGNRVIAIEPNPEMRRAAERLLAGYPGLHSVDGTAEATTLEHAVADFAVAGQAFHWFDPERARSEFLRVLRPGGWVVLLWNTRLVDTTPFLRDYENLLLEFGTDYATIDHRNIDAVQLEGFFQGKPERRTFANAQRFDQEGVRGRLLSSSYAPNTGHPRHAAMMEALDRVFHEHQDGGMVEFQYATEMYFARLLPPAH